MITAKMNEKDKMRILKKISGLSPKKQGSIIFNGFVFGALVMERELKKNVQSGILRKAYGKGFLARSMSHRIERSSSGITAIVGSGAKNNKPLIYAAIHQTGGIIRAKPGKILAFRIPGVARTKSGKAKRTKSDWIFAKQVTIPKRPYLTVTLNENRKRAFKEIVKAVEKQLEGK